MRVDETVTVTGVACGASLFAVFDTGAEAPLDPQAAARTVKPDERPDGENWPASSPA